MRSLLKILLISASLVACNSDAGNKVPAADSPAVIDRSGVDRDQAQQGETNLPAMPGASEFEASEKEREITRQITSNLIAVKSEMALMRSSVSDSLTKTGITPEKRSFYVKTLRQLDTGAELVNKEMENLLVSDLQKNHSKLSTIVKKMKDSEKELGVLIARLDRINTYLDAAAVLIQTLVPAVGAPSRKGSEN